jgi:hypothetical protein
MEADGYTGFECPAPWLLQAAARASVHQIKKRKEVISMARNFRIFTKSLSGLAAVAAVFAMSAPAQAQHHGARGHPPPHAHVRPAPRHYHRPPPAYHGGYRGHYHGGGGGGGDGLLFGAALGAIAGAVIAGSAVQAPPPVVYTTPPPPPPPPVYSGY